MAKGIIETALDMNPKEVRDLKKFIVEKILTRPELLEIHALRTGIKMKEQIVFASQFPKTGIKADGSCGQDGTNPASTLTQKYWDPVGIFDKLYHCNVEIDGLYKAYFSKIQRYRDRFDITGTDEQVFITILMTESAVSTIWRAVWFADKTVAVAGATTEGLLNADDVKYYDYFNGLLKQIYDGVIAGEIKRVTIVENAVTSSIEDQLALSEGSAEAYMDQIWSMADTRQRGTEGLIWLLSREMFDNYKQSLRKDSKNFTLDVTLNGIQYVSFDGKKIYNMEPIWDVSSREDFVNNTTDNVYIKPHKIILTTPDNIPVGTLSAEDFTDIKFWYNEDEELSKFKYGLDLDSKMLEPYMIAVGF